MTAFKNFPSASIRHGFIVDDVSVKGLPAGIFCFNCYVPYVVCAKLFLGICCWFYLLSFY